MSLYKTIESKIEKKRHKKLSFLYKNHADISDIKFIKKIFRLRVGYRLNLRNPKTFNEKMQWMKIHFRNPSQTTKVDKILVRNFVAKTIGEKYLIPLYGCWDKIDCKIIEHLPDKFVLKCNHDSGSCHVYDKNNENFDANKIVEYFNKRLSYNYYTHFYEWPYKNVAPRILCEKVLTPKSGSIIDYKFYIFDGNFKMLMLCYNRGTKEEQKVFLDEKLNIMPLTRKKYEKKCESVELPDNIFEMIKLAETLAVDDFFVRVDFYNCDKNIFFGEMTYFPGSGALKFYPRKFDYIIGSWLDLKKIKMSKYYVEDGL